MTVLKKIISDLNQQNKIPEKISGCTRKTGILVFTEKMSWWVNSYNQKEVYIKLMFMKYLQIVTCVLTQNNYLYTRTIRVLDTTF